MSERRAAVRFMPERYKRGLGAILIPDCEFPEPNERLHTWLFTGEGTLAKWTNCPGEKLLTAWGVRIPGIGKYRRSVAVDELSRYAGEQGFSLVYVAGVYGPNSFADASAMNVENNIMDNYKKMAGTR
ncbi:hypothetical protein STSP2_03134 [Anaerohalosphaera lusitana]|uniref:Uncharacterized protein n=1 Tax=Anaerohalosphaera lusitana TaxID=1936003 RepID=A0A1U9NQB9_9BACT|nr:hypothetical protein [Anaerohalosphaera lusitana]AQT69934.1 hypothetical protein STSP2_03134 [Anaerohalosphaera lusitana]